MWSHYAWLNNQFSYFGKSLRDIQALPDSPIWSNLNMIRHLKVGITILILIFNVKISMLCKSWLHYWIRIPSLLPLKHSQFLLFLLNNAFHSFLCFFIFFRFEMLLVKCPVDCCSLFVRLEWTFSLIYENVDEVFVVFFGFYLGQLSHIISLTNTVQFIHLNLVLLVRVAEILELFKFFLFYLFVLLLCNLIDYYRPEVDRFKVCLLPLCHFFVNLRSLVLKLILFLDVHLINHCDKFSFHLVCLAIDSPFQVLWMPQFPLFFCLLVEYGILML